MASPETLPDRRQWRIIAIVAAGVILVLLLAYYWFIASDYALLAQGLKAEEAGAIVEQLKKENVPYALRDSGTTILVPAKQLDSARLDISSRELPLKGTVGFELFNQSDMGLTDFAQKVNYQRALQGEIARTIMSMEGIAYARVHIALPERSLFRTSASEPRAAVTLTPEPGVEIDAQRIAGIQRLVAATVPDLALDQVAILNERGQLLTPEFSDVPGASGSESALEAQYRERAAGAVAAAAPRAHVEIKATVVSRPGGAGAPLGASGASEASGDAGGQRDHSIRIVLFERSLLTAAEEQAVRSAVTAELALDPRQGDELQFSPAPEIAAAVPQRIGAAAGARTAAPLGSGEQPRFLDGLARGWTVALLALAAIAFGFAAMRLERRRRGRRQALLEQIREHLLIAEGAADAA
jgi:flagellar M-ring protein FliF